MADKEATIFILDVGSTMAQRHSGRSESDLDWSMRYVWDKITDIVAANRKTLYVGVVGLRTDETENKLSADDGYENISVLQELGSMSMTALRELQGKIGPSGTWSGDAISAIVVAVDMMETFTKKLKYNRKIFLVTDGQGAMDADDTSDIAKKINDIGISLTVLGVDFDDPEYGFKEEDKTPTKAENEDSLKSLVNSCTNGVFASIGEAIDELDTPRIKSVKPYKSFDGTLTLGDPSKFPAAMEIHVERYFKVHQARPQGASTVVFNADGGPTQSTQTMDNDAMDGVEFSAVKQTRAYKVNDPDAPGGKKDVDFESLAKGYEYGRTAVHISESEHNITHLETIKEFTIIGFVEQSKYEPFLNIGEVGVTHAKKFDEKSELALSSLAWTLANNELYGVARLVAKEGKEPLLVLLIPHVELEFQRLYDVPLPFAEDIRSYQFPPLDRVITVSGQTLTKHRFLPSDDLNEAMSDYVDAMDLSTYGVDDNGDPAEYAPIDETFNPSIHRISHAIKHRAIQPDGTLPATPPILLKYSAPPQDLVEKVQNQIDALIELAEVKKVPPKAKGKRRWEPVKPLSGLDVDSLLGGGGGDKVGQISADNAIPDFKNALGRAEHESQFEEAAKQMGTIIRSLITDSFGNSKYERAVECMGTMREGLSNLEESGIYNSFLKDLKKRLLSGELGGDRRDFWFKIRMSRTSLGLVDQKEAEESDVTPAQADEFYKSR